MDWLQQKNENREDEARCDCKGFLFHVFFSLLCLTLKAAHTLNLIL